MRPRRGSTRFLNPSVCLVVSSAEGPRKGVVCECVVHIAEIDEHKCSRRFTAATTRIATGGVLIAGPGSVPKKGQYAGASWSGNGQDTNHPGKDGETGGHQRCAGSAR